MHTAREYYGLPGDAFALNDDGKPPNPLVDVGGMTSCALVHVCRSMTVQVTVAVMLLFLQPHEKNTERYQFIQNQVRRMVGGLPVHFSNEMYADKRQNVDRAESMAYFLKEKTDSLHTEETLKLYFQVCNSIWHNLSRP